MDDLAALLLQIEWGADEALEEAPVDRLRAVSPPPAPLPQGEGEKSIPKSPPTLAGGGWEEGAPTRPATSRPTPADRAFQSAAAATTLEDLRAAIAAFDGCALRDTASNLIFAEGDPSATLLLIGDPPGADEDRSGAAFAGPAGDYLDRMLAAISLERGQLVMAPLIPWRPPGDRPPSQAEIAVCLPFLHRLIALVAPRRLLLMGLLATRSLLPQAASRRRPRGEWMDAAIPGTSLVLPALPTFSAIELMRAPKDRRAAWDDLRLLRRTLDADAASS
jgi:uracil-DNA glycosylase